MISSSSSLCNLEMKEADKKKREDTKLLTITWSMAIRMIACRMFRVSAAMVILIGIPLSLRGSLPKSPSHFFHVFINSWDGLLHLNNYIPMTVTLLSSVITAYMTEIRKEARPKELKSDEKFITMRSCIRQTLSPTLLVTSFVILLLGLSVANQSITQVIWPSMIWNPFLWGRYKIYRPNKLLSATAGLCLEPSPRRRIISRAEDSEPLCLSNANWDILSSGGLSNKKKDDVETVMKGLNYFQNESGGLVINVLARNTINSIQTLRQNIEAIHRFIPSLTVLVFENDSTDGSREAFKQWAADASGYKVTLMECDEAPDCKLGSIHRYKSAKSEEYLQSSAIGKMPEFRQRMVDFVLTAPEFKSYTHMMVIDLDLQISLSPLGILHSIGKSTTRAIASSCRQSWPGTLGSIVPPYDFTAFRPTKTKENERIINLHDTYCSLAGPGHRWRNACDACSPLLLILAVEYDRYGQEKGELYPLDSAYNGAMIYPIELVRSSEAKYDWGDDRQRCEHIGFNLSLKDKVYVNPKWDMHIDPAKPGGPFGWDAMGKLLTFLWTTRFTILLGAQVMIPMTLYVVSMMILGTNVIFPFLRRSLSVAVVTRRKTKGDFHLPLLERKLYQLKET